MKARFVDEVTRLHRPYYAPVVVGVSAAAICIMLSVCSQDTASDGSIEWLVIGDINYFGRYRDSKNRDNGIPRL